MNYLQDVCQVMLIAFMGSFVFSLLSKHNLIEKGQVYLGWKMFDCLFCLTFWSCYTPLLIASFFISDGDAIMTIQNIMRSFLLSAFATPIAKLLNSK